MRLDPLRATFTLSAAAVCGILLAGCTAILPGMDAEQPAAALDAAVVKSSDGKVVINRGAASGIQPGQTLVMHEAVPGAAGKEIGRLMATRVLDGMTYCDVSSGERSPKPGTPVTTE